jgi:RluA family pseudouridine synthase
MLDLDDVDDTDGPTTLPAIEPIIIGPFRFIKPYYFTFKCRAKGRWFDRPLIDVFAQEFKHWSREVLEQRIVAGDITVNGSPIPVTYKIKQRDEIEHSILRCESPVYATAIVTLGETDDYIAFLKPASVPVHATGGYFYNALVKQVGGRYHPVHRLDRVTSGIIVMAKTKESAQRFGDMLIGNSIHKTYLARVIGEFPPDEVRCDAPIREGVRDRSVRECGDGGKSSVTIFRRLSTNGRESIIECQPITGRTHQIRVHLSHLGFPITNDELYGGRTFPRTPEEERAFVQAEEMKLWPPDAILSRDDPFLVFQIFLHSIHYSSDVFDFSAPQPDWADLPKSEAI